MRALQEHLYKNILNLTVEHRKITKPIFNRVQYVYYDVTLD